MSVDVSWVALATKGQCGLTDVLVILYIQLEPFWLYNTPPAIVLAHAAKGAVCSLIQLFPFGFGW